MPSRQLDLPADPEAALGALQEASKSAPVLVFKRSPICPVSTMAEAEYRNWLQGTDAELAVAEIDVIAERGLARGLTAALDIRHESPQALLFREGALTWHGSHGELVADTFAGLLATP